MSEVFIGAIDLTPYVRYLSISGDQERIHNILLEGIPASLQEDLYLLLNAFNAEQEIEWEQRLRFYTRGLNFAITRWSYENWGSLSDLKLYHGFSCRVKLTLDKGKWYRLKEQSWEINPIFSSER